MHRALIVLAVLGGGLLVVLAMPARRSWSRPAQPPSTGTPTATRGTPQPSITPTRDTGSPLPDLVIDRLFVTLDPAVWCHWDQAEMGTGMVVRNAGEVPAGAFSLAVLGIRHRLMGLAAGEDRTVWVDDYRPIGQGETDAAVDIDHEVREYREDNNARRELLPVPTLQATCMPTSSPTPPTGTPEPLPDLAPDVTYAWLCPCWPCADAPYGTVCLRNGGAVAADESEVQLLFGPVREGRSLAPIAAAAATCWRIPSMSVDVVADVREQVREADEANNRRRFWAPTYTPPPPCPVESPTPSPTAPTSTPPTPGALPDLLIADVRSEREWNGRCWDNGPHWPLIDVKIQNAGLAPAGHFVVRAEPPDNASWEVSGFAVGESRWLGQKVGWAQVLVADADNEVAESDETNNRLVRQPTPAMTEPLPCTPVPPRTPRPAFMPSARRDGR